MSFPNSRYGILWWINNFWPLPLPLNKKMPSSLDFILIAPNSRGYVQNLPSSIKDAILIIEAGGYLPGTAGSLKRLQLIGIETRLEKIQEERKIPSNTTLLVPQTMALSLGWHNIGKYNNYSIRIVSDYPWDIDPINTLIYSKPRLWWRRVVSALTLTLGQMIVFTVALVAFGMSTLFFGLGSLFIAGLLVVISRVGHKKRRWVTHGLLTGLVSGIIGGITAFLLPEHAVLTLKITVGLLLCSVWMGIIYEGVYP